MSEKTKTRIMFKIPALAAWLSLFYTSMRIYAGEATTIQEVTFWIAICTLGGLGIFVLLAEFRRGAAGKQTHIKEIIREVEKPVEYVDYYQEEEQPVESWVEYDTPNGIQAVRQDVSMNDEETKTHFSVHRPGSPDECDRLIKAYKKKGFGKTVGFLLNAKRALIADQNKTRTDRADRTGERRLRMPRQALSPTLELSLKNGE